jgi:formamidopyrimidine-DNA glycosylase
MGWVVVTASRVSVGHPRDVHRHDRIVFTFDQGELRYRNMRMLDGQRGRREPKCPRCRAELSRTKIAGRTSYWCPRCQRAPRG